MAIRLLNAASYSFLASALPHLECLGLHFKADFDNRACIQLESIPEQGLVLILSHHGASSGPPALIFFISSQLLIPIGEHHIIIGSVEFEPNPPLEVRNSHYLVGADLKYFKSAWAIHGHIIVRPSVKGLLHAMHTWRGHYPLYGCRLIEGGGPLCWA